MYELSLKSNEVQKILKIKQEEINSFFRKKELVNSQDIIEIVVQISTAIDSGKKVAFVGNGGSAAEAMHIAAEFTGKCVLDHPPLPVICLNESQSSITAIANDFGFEKVFSRQVEAHLQPGDLLICLSTSGKSKNILEAIRVARKKGVNCMIWTGSSELSIEGVKVFKVDSNSTPRIQEVHLIWGHLVAEIIELLLSD